MCHRAGSFFSTHACMHTGQTRHVTVRAAARARARQALVLGGNGTARAPEMMPSTEGRLRMNHSVHIHDNEPVAADICVFKHAIAARGPAEPVPPLRNAPLAS